MTINGINKILLTRTTGQAKNYSAVFPNVPVSARTQKELTVLTLQAYTK